MPDQIYVVGHINPDTDSVASAMGYAWLLRERDGANTVAARAGALNPQTSWVLKTLGLEPPLLLTDASPRFESVMHRLDSISPDAQLGMAWTLASRTGGLAPVVNEDGTPYGIGIRNTVGLTWDPDVDKLFAVQHGRDDLHRFWPELYTPEQSRDMPAEEFLMVEEGDNFGWPYCYYDQFQGKKMLCPEYGGDGKTQGRCEGIKSPLVAFPGHWAPNDVLIYKGNMFPEKYKNGAFIAFHGSWNRLNFEQAGFLVAFVPMKDGKPTGDYEIFANGFPGPQQIVSTGDATYRPCGLAEGPDGSLYVADSQKGRVWRICYYGEGSGITSKPVEHLTADAGNAAGGSNLTGAMALGKTVYDQYCKVCHMANGRGVPNLNPPLKGTDWVLGEKPRLINVVLQGLNAPIEINGEKFQNAMAPHAFLSDEQIAGVLTFIRGSFDNNAGEVTAEEVAAERAKLQ
ncbi:MAG TPA: PQQ-dependent sugar dehydrogenase [Flavilitoribacter sp.]|nr:PQQ-dependent sugar dehydrogenase [Flavilitoribacter sp.]